MENAASVTTSERSYLGQDPKPLDDTTSTMGPHTVGLNVIENEEDGFVLYSFNEGHVNSLPARSTPMSARSAEKVDVDLPKNGKEPVGDNTKKSTPSHMDSRDTEKPETEHRNRSGASREAPGGLTEEGRKRFIELQNKIDRGLQNKGEVEDKGRSVVVAADEKHSMETIASNKTKSDPQKVNESDLKDDRGGAGSAVESRVRSNLAINQVKGDGSSGDPDPKVICEKTRAEIKAHREEMNKIDPDSKEYSRLENKLSRKLDTLEKLTAALEQLEKLQQGEGTRSEVDTRPEINARHEVVKGSKDEGSKQINTGTHDFSKSAAGGLSHRNDNLKAPEGRKIYPELDEIVQEAVNDYGLTSLAIVSQSGLSPAAYKQQQERLLNRIKNENLNGQGYQSHIQPKPASFFEKDQQEYFYTQGDESPTSEDGLVTMAFGGIISESKRFGRTLDSLTFNRLAESAAGAFELTDENVAELHQRQEVSGYLSKVLNRAQKAELEQQQPADHQKQSGRNDEDEFQEGGLVNYSVYDQGPTTMQIFNNPSKFAKEQRSLLGQITQKKQHNTGDLDDIQENPF